MRFLRPASVAALLVLAACSGSDGEADDEEATATTAADVVDEGADVGESDDAAASTDDDEVDDGAEASDDTVLGDAESSSDAVGVDEDVDDDNSDANSDDTGDTGAADVDDESSDDDADNDGGFTINGPARVRPSCDSLARGVNEFTLEAGGFVHDVRMYVPQTISSDPAPVVLNWHGLGSDGPEQAAFTGYEALAEQEGFLVVHPTGAGIGGANSWELPQFENDEIDDVEFADALIDTVVEDWCADEARVYSTGMSNGGLFTSVLVCNRSERIAAAASVAGLTHSDECEPERPVPYVAYHGTADNVVPFGGGEESILLPPDAVDALIGEGTPSEFAEFAADNGCDPDPVRTEETAEVIRYDYTGCENDIPMTFYEIVDGGHTWPSSPLADEAAALEASGFTFDVDATTDAWVFMSQHSL